VRVVAGVKRLASCVFSAASADMSLQMHVVGMEHSCGLVHEIIMLHAPYVVGQL
jgi:hypothetical protein